MSRPFSIHGTAVDFGVGASERTGRHLRRLGARSALIVTDESVAAAGLAAPVAESVTGTGVGCETLVVAAGEPTSALIEEVAASFGRSEFESVVGVGGGAAIDVAKIIALLLADGGPVDLYVNAPYGAGREPRRPLPPLVAVPTTSGSGSDVSAVAVLELSAAGVKTAISHRQLRPQVTVADPAMTLSAPAATTLGAGLDALAHALESLTARPPAGGGDGERVYAGRNAYSDALCQAALPLLTGALPRVVADGADLSAREDMMLAATLANLGAAVAGAHAGHALAYALAARTPGISHGLLVGILQPALLEAALDGDPQRHAAIADKLDGREPVRAVRDVLRACGVNGGLVDCGITEADIPAITAQAMEQKRLVANAPACLDQRALQNVVRQSLHV